MDGGSRQREEAQKLKSQIKKSSSARREKRRTHIRGFIVTSERDYADQAVAAENQAGTAVEDGPPEPITTDTDGSKSATEATQWDGLLAPVSISKRSTHIRSTYPDAQSVPFQRRYPQLNTPESARRLVQTSTTMALAELGQEFDLELVMMYLDYDFPFLFPFYRAPMESRSWLLPFLTTNKAVLHSAQSLSSYFFTAALRDVFPDAQNQCKTSVWLQVVEEADKCFAKIQYDLRNINQPDSQATVVEKARVMESIIQLLIFEMFIQVSGDWKMHLNPAISLFKQIMQGQTPGVAGDFHLVLQTLGGQTPDNPPEFRRLGFNPDQAAFRFFTAVLLFVDIIASTSLQKPPCLKDYHSSLLKGPSDADETAALDLASFVGCHNWVICSLGEASALASWKIDMQKTGRLSVPELVSRAEEISQSLQRGLERLDRTTPSSALRSVNINRLQAYYDINLPKSDAGLSVIPTRIWTHAILIYLSIIVSGWQPSSVEIRHNVEKVLMLLQDVKCSAQIRTLAWPICIAGCLAQPGEQEQSFRKIILGAGDLLRTSGRTMEAVWSRRDTQDYGTLDMADCLSILGSPCLLI